MCDDYLGLTGYSFKETSLSPNSNKIFICKQFIQRHISEKRWNKKQWKMALIFTMSQAEFID